MPRLLAITVLGLAALSCSSHRGTSPAPIAARAVPVSSSAPVPSPPASPAFESRSVDRAVGQAIARGDVPGAVVLVVDRERVLFSRAYGDRALVPEKEAMTTDSIFDLASLTKPLAAAAAILTLVEDGAIDLRAPAARYLPSFAPSPVTVEDLLLHVAGLPADAPMGRDQGSRGANVAAALRIATPDPPRQRFRYSDLGYIALGAMVERVSGERLDVFLQRRVFGPLGLRDTSFGARDRARAVPTEARAGAMLRGDVHDPRAARLGGVAGHAGLFATADDLGRFARALLRGGELDGVRVWKESTVETMLSPRAVPSGSRALGWDVDTGYSHPRGEVLGKRGFGHTGFTGTSLWVDRETGVGLVVLTSRLHPTGGGDARRLRREVADAVGHVVLGDPRRGVDVLEDHDFAALAGRHVALLTNDAARDAQGRRTLDVLAGAPGVAVEVVLSAEHGLGIDREGAGTSTRDPATGLPVVAAYGKSLPSVMERLTKADTLVIDLPDAGARFFTYAATAAQLATIARKRGLRVVVLDRENPLGTTAEGPVPDVAGRSLVAFLPVPIRHGRTLGGLLAQDGDVDVVGIEGGDPDRSAAERGGAFARPSPNLRTAAGALLYPGVALLELTHVSVGRGTDTPFELVGAPYVDGARLARALDGLGTPGVHAVPARFVPASGPFAGVACGGVRLVVHDPRGLEPVRLGVAIASALLRAYPRDLEPENLRVLLAHEATYQALLRGDPLASITRGWGASAIVPTSTVP